jgi:exonuclease VII small subunit
LSIIPKIFIKTPFGGPVITDATHKIYWSNDEQFCRKVLSGELPPPDATSENPAPARKTTAQLIADCQAALSAAQKRIPGLIANRDAAKVAFEAMPEQQFADEWKSARQDYSDTETFLTRCREEITRLENKLSALKADANEESGAE